MPKLAVTYTKPQVEIFFPTVETKYTAVPKGRRFGGTRGGANAFLEWAIEGQFCLWGDTIRANILKYLDLYFYPALDGDGSDPVAYKWEERKHVLHVGDNGGFIDFRSADKPENWEGFGYHRVFLNEAGIIMKNRDLYTKTVLPMLIDYPDSRVYFVGTPKGKTLRDGTEHPFYTVAMKGEHGVEGYRTLRFDSYANKLLDEESLRELEAEIKDMEPGLEDQEIHGRFIDSISGNKFAFAFDADVHVGTAERRPNDLHYFSIDFNVDPFTAIASHIWTDSKGDHYHTFDEYASKKASIEDIGKWIVGHCPNRSLIRITGDRGGLSRSISAKGSVKMFVELCTEIQISKNQLSVPANPFHVKSREDFNFILANHPDRTIDRRCVRLISDHKSVGVDGEGKIKKADRSKASQQADALDCDRYMVNTYLRAFIQKTRR